MFVPSTQDQTRQQSGFTLIEIMVVVAIIGVLVAMIGISMSRDADRLARLEAKRFHAVVNEVRDEAILSGQDYWLEVNDDTGSYGFSSAHGQQRSDSLFVIRQTERDVTLQWEVLDAFVESIDEEEGDVARARVLITALGEITAFEASFSGDEREYRVFVNDEGQLEQGDNEARKF